MTVTAEARVPTAHASKYLQQVCKHWTHNLAVEFDTDRGTVVFPKNARGAEWPGDATVTFDAEGDALVTRIDASADGQLQVERRRRAPPRPLRLSRSTAEFRVGGWLTVEPFVPERSRST